MLKTLFVGIDISERNNVVRFTDSYGDTLTVFSVQNNQYGANILLKKLHDTLMSTNFQVVYIGMEFISIYTDHLATFFCNDGFLKKWDVKLIVQMLNSQSF